MTETHSPPGPNEALQAVVSLDAVAVRQILRRVIDPEVGLNIVDLGLVYRIEAAPDRVAIDLTMTSPACPLGEQIVEEAYDLLVARLPGAARIDIALVWEPPWSPDMIAAEARLKLGWSA